MASPTESVSGSTFTTSNPPVPRETPGSIPPQPIATPTFGTGGSFSIVVATHIAAPPDAVFTVITQHTKWPEWCRLVRKLTVISSPGPTTAGPDANALETLIQGDDGSTYLKKDAKVYFQVHLDPDDPASSGRKEAIQITLLERFDHAGRKGWRIGWKPTGYPNMAMRSERVQEVVDDGKGGTEYTSWETMYGFLAPVVRLTTGTKIERGFQCWAEDLKKRSEERVTAETAPPLGE
ncbi:hypothetical protein diail_7512 [Diaporthe ilicicola]|nr:hypothetical protein diail_7512 [Diaporthe ilicicola]